MCAFTRAGVVDGSYDPYLAAHPKTAALLAAMAKPVASLLATPYWSGLPFRLGEGFVKYKLEPVLALDAPGEPPRDPAYPSAVTLALIYKATTRDAAAADFIAFATSDHAKRVLEERGGAPLKP